MTETGGHGAELEQDAHEKAEEQKHSSETFMA